MGFILANIHDVLTGKLKYIPISHLVFSSPSLCNPNSSQCVKTTDAIWFSWFSRLAALISWINKQQLSLSTASQGQTWYYTSNAPFWCFLINFDFSKIFTSLMKFYQQLLDIMQASVIEKINCPALFRDGWASDQECDIGLGHGCINRAGLHLYACRHVFA